MLAGIAQAAVIVMDVAVNADLRATERDFVDQFGMTAQHNSRDKEGWIATMLADGRQDSEEGTATAGIREAEAREDSPQAAGEVMRPLCFDGECNEIHTTSLYALVKCDQYLRCNLAEPRLWSLTRLLRYNALLLAAFTPADQAPIIILRETRQRARAATDVAIQIGRAHV